MDPQPVQNRVLVVEPFRESLRTISRLLSRLLPEYQLDFANSVSAGMIQARKAQPNIVVLCLEVVDLDDAELDELQGIRRQLDRLTGSCELAKFILLSSRKLGEHNFMVNRVILKSELKELANAIREILPLSAKAA